jgi:hypothetical protein
VFIRVGRIGNQSSTESLGLEVGTHVQQQHRVKGGVFDMEQAARKLLKEGAFFKSILEKGSFLEFGATIYVKRGTF